MDRVNAVLHHPLFRKSIERTAELELCREFCRHGLDHLLDTARIAYILCLESGVETSKELVYAAAMLHDIGRWRQYEDGTPHEIESARIARKILPECGFDDIEIDQIADAIAAHRTKTGEKHGFLGILYRADKLSRRCNECAARDDCDWTMKNMTLEY